MISRNGVLRSWLALALALASLIVAVPAKALAQTPSGTISPMCVAPDAGYTYVGRSVTYIDAQRVYGTKGLPLTLSISMGTGITGTVGGQLSGDLNLIVAGAKASVDSSISLTKTVAATASTTWIVPTATGWLAVGAIAQSGNWQYGYFDCGGRWVVQRSGSYVLPTLAPAFYHS